MGRPKSSKNLQKERKNYILDIHFLGVKQKGTAEFYSMPQSTVSKIIRRGCDNNDESKTENRGRKPKLSTRFIRVLL